MRGLRRRRVRMLLVAVTLSACAGLREERAPVTLNAANGQIVELPDGCFLDETGARKRRYLLPVYRFKLLTFTTTVGPCRETD